MLYSYNDINEFLEWQKIFGKLKFDDNYTSPDFPILYNHIYWAYLGCNVGSEQDKHRPVLVTRSSSSSPICTIIPLTTKRIADGYWYHIDLEFLDSTALVEQMRVVDKRRIDKPMRVKGSIACISKNDWNNINNQIQKNYLLKPFQNKTHK